MILNKRFLINSLLIFCIIYDISFVKFPGLTTSRIAFVFIFFKSISYYKSIRINKDFVYFLILLVFLFIASIIQYLSSMDFTQSSRILWFTLYSIITPFMLRKFFLNLEEFLNSILFVTFLQSIIAIFSFFNPIIKNRILDIIITGGNDIEDNIYRAITFSSTTGAALSIIQFCGVFSGLLLLKYFSDSYRKSIIIWLGILICLLSTLVIGRTGLICSIISIFYFIFSSTNIKNLAIFITLTLCISQINYNSILDKQTYQLKDFSVDYFVNWINEGYQINNNRTFDAIYSMNIPALSSETFFGTGKVFNKANNSNSSGNDSGYIQTYYSLGLIFSIFFYLGYIYFLINNTNRNIFFGYYFLISLMLLVELKEPFIFKYIISFYILNLKLLFDYSKNNNLIPNITK